MPDDNSDQFVECTTQFPARTFAAVTNVVPGAEARIDIVTSGPSAGGMGEIHAESQDVTTSASAVEVSPQVGDVLKSGGAQLPQQVKEL